MNEIRQWVKDVGAPIAAAAFLGWLVVRLNDQARLDRASERQEHSQEIERIVGAFERCCHAATKTAKQAAE